MKNPVEHGDPAAGLDGFRRSLGEFATGVTVITTGDGETRYGMTSNSFTSVSLDPPLVLWSVRRESQSFAAFEKCSHFAVNVLASDQMDVSQRFARSGPDKFDGIRSNPGVGGAPVIEDVAASFECRRTESHDGGDHLILVGQVENFCRYDRQPLLFAKGRYAVAADHPDTRVFSAPAEGPASSEMDEQLLSLLMVRAYSAIASQLEKSRRSAGLGLSLMQARLLKAAHTHPDSTLDELLPETFLDFNVSQNVLDSDVELGLVVVDDRERVRLTAEGEKRIRSIIEHTRANEEMLFQGISSDDLSTVQRVLNKVIADQEKT